MKEFIEKILWILLVCVLILGSATAVSWITPDKRVVKEVANYKIKEGNLEHYAYLKPNEYYGRNCSLEYYPTSLVEDIVLNYKFKSEQSIRGNYTFRGIVVYSINTGRDKDHVILEKEIFEKNGSFVGCFSANYTLNVSKLNMEISKVLGDLKVRSLKPKVYFEITTCNGTFKHRIDFIKDSGLIHFENTRKVTKIPEYSNRVFSNKVMGIDVWISRILFTIPLTVLLPIFAYSSYLRVERRAKGLDKYAVDCESVRFDGKGVLFLRSEDDLKKVFEVVDKPIVKRGENYMIIDENAVYIYKDEK